MASAGGSYWGAQGSQSQGSSQGSAQSVNGMYQAGNSANAGTAGTGGSAGTAGAGAGTGAGTSGTNGATEGSADTGGTAGTSGAGTGTSGSGSQYAGSASQSNAQAGTGQQAGTNQGSVSQAQGTAQGTGQGSGQSSNGAYYGTGSTGGTQGQTNGQSQWSGQGQTSQGQTVQGQQESQANTQPAAQNSNWNANSNSNALNSGSQSPSQSGYDDGMWHGNEQSKSGQNQKSQTNKDTNALNQESTESKDSKDSKDSTDPADSTDSKASTDSTKPEKDQMNDGQWHPELWSESATNPSSTTKSTNSPSSTHSDLPSTESPTLPSSGSHRLSPGAEAGIAVGVMSLVLLLLGLIFFRLHRKKRALQMAVRSERNLPPLEKQNHMYNLASNLYTKSSLTLVGMSDTFKGRGNNSDGSLGHQHQHPSHNYNTNRQSIHDGPAAANESTSTFNSAITQLPPPVLLTGQTHPALRRPTWKARSQRALSPFTATASYAVNKVKALRQKELSPAQRRSLQAHEYGFSEEFLHIPPPPEPTRRLPRVLSKVQDHGSLTVRAVTQKLNRSQTSLARSQKPHVDYQAHVQEHPQEHMQPPPPAQVQDDSHCQCGAQIPVQPQTQTQYQAYVQPQAQAPAQPQAPVQPQAQPQAQPQPQPQTEKSNNGLSSWGTMNSLNSVSESSEEHREGDTRFPSPCEMIGEELFKVRSVSSGTVAMNNPAANISVDALAGRISGENEQPERSKSSKSAKSTQSKSQPQQPQHPRSPPQSKPPSPSLPTQPSLAEQPAQAEVPSIKPWSVHVYRVDMPFAARSTGHLEVSEGMMVRLDQAFDDGWALCTVAQTDQRGLIPRACLSTWPLKERRNYTASMNDPHIRNASSASLPISPVDSMAAQSFRFYRQASSRPGTPKDGVVSPTSSTRSGSGSGSGS